MLAALGLVGIIVILVVKLRRRGDRGEKDFDDGGLSSAGRRCVAGNNSDKVRYLEVFACFQHLTCTKR